MLRHAHVNLDVFQDWGLSSCTFRKSWREPMFKGVSPQTFVHLRPKRPINNQQPTTSNTTTPHNNPHNPTTTPRNIPQHNNPEDATTLNKPRQLTPGHPAICFFCFRTGISPRRRCGSSGTARRAAPWSPSSGRSPWRSSPRKPCAWPEWELEGHIFLRFQGKSAWKSPVFWLVAREINRKALFARLAERSLVWAVWKALGEQGQSVLEVFS